MNAQFYVNAWKASARSLEWRRNLNEFLKDRSEHVTLETTEGNVWFSSSEPNTDRFTGV